MRSRSMQLRACCAVVALVSAAPQPAAAQRKNPDISAIGDARAAWSEAEDRTELFFEELEVALVGPLNPYASAEVYVGIHGTTEVEIEEAKLLLDRYFPGGFGLTAGHYLIDFGQLNQIHSHAYPFADRALMHEELFGPDGVVDTGARVDWIAPIDVVTLRATAGAVRGELFVGGGHAHEGTEVAAPDPEIGGSGRIDVFVELSEDFSFLAGGSVLHGKHDPDHGAYATFWDIDAKARLDLGPSRTLVVNAEGILGAREATDEAAASDPNGWFVSADFRTDRRWNFGGFAESTTDIADDSVRTSRWGGFLGLALMEETTVFRLVGRMLDSDETGTSGEVVVQALFGLGPHRPHRY
jgi:hypothetical protein